MKGRILGIILCSFLFVNCGEKNSDTTAGVEQTKDDKSLDANFDPNRLLGKWVSTQGKGTFTEEWTETDGAFEGIGYELDGTKKINVEYLTLKPSDEKWVYGAKMNRQNNNEEVLFESAKSSFDHIEFCNVEHENPNTITYHFTNDSKLNIRVFGKDSSFELKMKKVE